MKVRDVIRLIKADGWYQVRMRGSHRQFRHPEKRGLVTVAGFSAYSPDVPGCVATGRTEEETEARMKEAIEFHIDGLKQEGLAVPLPSTKSAYVDIAA